MDQQSDIGWHFLLEGGLTTEWENAQQEYYALIRSQKPSWVAVIICKLWWMAWEMWIHRNGILHMQESIITKGMERKINQEIKMLSSKAGHPDICLQKVFLHFFNKSMRIRRSGPDSASSASCS
jgi:hypothetical protein